MRSVPVLIVLSLCGLLAAPASVHALQPVRVIVFPGGFNWPIWAAQHEGYFSDEGIAVDVTPTPSSAYQMTNLISGKYDIAMTAFDNVVAYDSGQGAAKVSGTHDLFAFMGGDDGFLSIVVPDRIRTFADLKGGVLAVDALTTGYAFVLEQMLADHGLSRGEYRLESAGGVLERWKALLAGRFSGTLLVTPFDILSQAHGFHPLGYAIDDLRHYQGVVGATRRAWAAQHRRELAGYIRAYRRGLAWLYNRAHREDALRVLETHVPNMTPGLAEKSYSVLLGHTGGFSRTAKLDLPGIREVIRLRLRYGVQSKALENPANFYDGSYYDAASAGMVKPVQVAGGNR